jgi:cytochrome c553
VTIRSLVSLNAVFAVLLTATSAQALAQGNAQAGEAKAAACAACHGATGNDSLLPNVPKIGGQGERYLLKQLVEIKEGVRPVPLMEPVVAPLSEQDLADLAAFYAQQELPLGAVDPAKRAVGEQLFRAGNAAIGVAACSACHAPNGKGNEAAGYPALSGQDVAYTELQLRAFRAGERTNDAAEAMRTTAARLSDAEIAALASYISGLR